MRIAIYAALLFATPAAAQSVESANPRPCQVTIARAPEDVRAVVETWVRTEAKCSVALEVRIVTTEGGFYLLAQDERGRMRERIVPDAQTAGVLVASWIADDNAPLPPPPVIAPIDAPRTVAPILAPVVAPKSPAIRSESITPPGLAPVAIAETKYAPVRRSKWISAGTLVPMSEGSGLGVRAEADAFRSGRWLVGGAVSLANSSTPMWTGSGLGAIDVTDIKLLVYLSRPWVWSRWQLRPTLGVGMLSSQGLAYDGNGMTYYLEQEVPTLEASLVASRDLGRSWAVYAGPIATLIDQTFDGYSSTEPYQMLIKRGLLDLAIFAGVRHRL
ncbi:MAG TPA: hypothetical protein VIV11_32865 [Kofleriaceae bacterium]